jgi:hypothetical protein
MDGRGQDDIRTLALDINPRTNIRLVDDPARRRHKWVMAAATARMAEQDMPHIAVALLELKPRIVPTRAWVNIRTPMLFPHGPTNIRGRMLTPPGHELKNIVRGIMYAMANLATLPFADAA